MRRKKTEKKQFYIGDIFRDISGGCHCRHADGADHITQGFRQAVNGGGQLLQKLRRDLLGDSGQVHAGGLQIAQQRLIEIRQHADKAVDLPDQPGQNAVAAHITQMG